MAAWANNLVGALLSSAHHSLAANYRPWRGQVEKCPLASSRLLSISTRVYLYQSPSAYAYRVCSPRRSRHAERRRRRMSRRRGYRSNEQAKCSKQKESVVSGADAEKRLWTSSGPRRGFASHSCREIMQRQGKSAPRYSMYPTLQ